MSWILKFKWDHSTPNTLIIEPCRRASPTIVRTSASRHIKARHPVFPPKIKLLLIPKAVGRDIHRTRKHTHAPVAKANYRTNNTFKSILDASCLLSDMTFQARAAESPNLSYLGIQGAEKRERDACRQTDSLELLTFMPGPELNWTEEIWCMAENTGLQSG